MGPARYAPKGNHMTIARLRSAIYASQRGMPKLDDWLKVAASIDPAIATAVEGIYCGMDGEMREPVPGFYDRTGQPNHYLVMQWHNGRVETAYIS